MVVSPTFDYPTRHQHNPVRTYTRVCRGKAFLVHVLESQGSITNQADAVATLPQAQRHQVYASYQRCAPFATSCKNALRAIVRSSETAEHAMHNGVALLQEVSPFLNTVNYDDVKACFLLSLNQKYKLVK